MYFMGVFDTPPPPIQDTNKTKTTKKDDDVKVVKYTHLKRVKFNPSDIDTKRLNIRLSVLTKNTILTKKQIQEQKHKQEQRLLTLKKEQQFIAFAHQNKEEPIKLTTKNIQQTNKSNNNSFVVQKDNLQKQQTINDNIKPNENRFVTTTSLNYKLFRDLVIQAGSKTARISICSNMKETPTIFIGPFIDANIQYKVKELIKSNNIEAQISNITTQEFDKNCNF